MSYAARLKAKDLIRIECDPQANAVYVQLRDGEVAETLMAGQYVCVDVDNKGIQLGIELLVPGRLIAIDGWTSIMVNLAPPSSNTDGISNIR